MGCKSCAAGRKKALRKFNVPRSTIRRPQNRPRSVSSSSTSVPVSNSQIPPSNVKSTSSSLGVRKGSSMRRSIHQQKPPTPRVVQRSVAPPKVVEKAPKVIAKSIDPPQQTTSSTKTISKPFVFSKKSKSTFTLPKVKAKPAPVKRKVPVKVASTVPRKVPVKNRVVVKQTSYFQPKSVDFGPPNIIRGVEDDDLLILEDSDEDEDVEDKIVQKVKKPVSIHRTTKRPQIRKPIPSSTYRI